MDEQSIIALPEIREMILSHLDKASRQEALLVCPAFYEIICFLERNRNLRLCCKEIVDDNIFRSIMQTSRQFKSIKIFGAQRQNIVVKRIIAMLKKFRKHLKALILHGIPTCTQKLLEEMLNLEELSILEFGRDCYPRIIIEGNYVLRKEFSRLKKLSVCAFEGIAGILEKISDDSLEVLFMKWPDPGLPLSAASLQTFLNRQTRLKKLKVRLFQNLNLDHLALQKLWLDGSSNELARILSSQLGLRVLSCGFIASPAVRELNRMKNLEALRGTFAANTLSQVKLSTLTKLVLTQASLLESEDFVGLSRDTKNLQHISISSAEVNVLPAIIDNFPALKTLFMGDLRFNEEFVAPAPSRKNSSLEELVIIRGRYFVPAELLHDCVNACPNIKRISMTFIGLTSSQVLNLVQNHPKLTHFWLRPWHIYEEHMIQDRLDPLLLDTINIFKNSPEFISLRVMDPTAIHYCHSDADQIEVVRHNFLGNCYIILRKMPENRDTFDNFCNKSTEIYDE